MKKLTTIEFIENAKKKHGECYDYSKVLYSGRRDMIKILCPIHGLFEINAYVHLKGSGCSLCGNSKKGANKKKDLKSFIDEAIKIHGDKYDYSLSEYVGYSSNIKIKCPEHGIFIQTPKRHIGHEKRGCRRCNANNKLTNANWIEKFKSIHGERYGYEKTHVLNSKTHVTVTCFIHGLFIIKPEVHAMGRGCKICGCVSTGENEIRRILNNRNIKFEEQKQFENCKNIQPLRFDFYLNEQNLLLEYDGIHHFKDGCFGGKSVLENVRLRDEIKNKYAQINGIDLVRIAYYEKNNIENIIKRVIK